jgi:hypothetical protein
MILISAPVVLPRSRDRGRKSYPFGPCFGFPMKVVPALGCESRHHPRLASLLVLRAST